MKIWIDFINTPQVSFFLPFIKEFEREGHEVFLTCRDSGNTVSLLQSNNLDFHLVGDVVKRSTIDKILYFPRRILALWRVVKKNKPDFALGQSSFYMPVVAKMLGVPSLYTNDNEHAKGNILGFLFSDSVVLPLALESKKFTHRWPLKGKIDFYPGVKEAIYLSQNTTLTDVQPSTADSVIYFRPEPDTAQYYDGPKHFFDQVLKDLAKLYHVVILPRSNEQIIHYQSLTSEGIEVRSSPLSFDKIVSNCLLFIGAGGSMNRELAVLGVPVVSVYQAHLLAVDQYLIDAGYITLAPKITAQGLVSIINQGRPNLDTELLLTVGKKSFRLLLEKIKTLQNA